MLAKRIIPCLDIKDGRTVKGINFLQIRDAGDPVELAMEYCRQGADELVFLDITATFERRKTMAELVNEISAAINIPFTVGGGINSLHDVEALLQNGADKVSINSAAFKDPRIIREISKGFGSQCAVVAIDTKYVNGEWKVFLNGGRLNTGAGALDWAKRAQDMGAGEILLTSMNNDGTKNGFAIDITAEIADTLSIPVIASGGAGTLAHFSEVFKYGHAEAALAASVFHYNEITIPALKEFLRSENIFVRL